MDWKISKKRDVHKQDLEGEKIQDRIKELKTDCMEEIYKLH